MRHGLQLADSQSYPPSRFESLDSLTPDGQVSATIAKMKQLLHGPHGLRSFFVKQKTYEAVRGVQRGRSEVESIFHWIKDNIEFRGEYGETLQSPEATLRLGAGDCDDQSTLAATMLESLGFETRFKTMAPRGSDDELSHVYVVVKDKHSGEWIPLDPTVAESYPGWEPESARSEVYSSNSPWLLNSGDGIGVLLFGGLLAFALSLK